MTQVLKLPPPIVPEKTLSTSPSLSSKTPRRLPAIDESKEPAGSPVQPRLLSPDAAAATFASSPRYSGRRASICASNASPEDISSPRSRRMSLAGLPPDVAQRRNSFASNSPRTSPNRSPMMGRMSLTSPASSLSKASSDADSDADEAADEVAPEKTDKVKAMLAAALRNNVMVQNLDKSVVDQVVELMWSDSLLAGQHLIEPGDHVDKVYVLEKGEVQIQMSPRGRRPARTLGPGSLLAEVALLHDGPSSQSISCKTDITFWLVEGAVFRSILQEATKKQMAEQEELLAKLPFFKLLDREDVSRLADAVQVQTFDDGETVLKTNEPETSLYVIESGSVRSTREVRHVAGAIAPKASEQRTMPRGSPLTSSGTFSASQANLLRSLENLGDISGERERSETTTTNSETLKRGDYFGEISIISRAPSEATYTVVGPTRLLVISKELLADLVDITSVEEIVRSTLRHRRRIAPLTKSPPVNRRVLPGFATRTPLPALSSSQPS